MQQSLAAGTELHLPRSTGTRARLRISSGNERKTDIEVIIGKDGKFSLRSVPPISHLIAREFGGGGHPNAAGGSFNFTVIERFTWWLFKKNRHFNEFVTIADKH